jgi:NTE family protein
MTIDTLVLSGGGPSGIAYIGMFKALFEKNILKKDLSGIKEIITTSAGILFSVLYMLKIKEDQIKQMMIGLDFETILDSDSLHIDDLLVNLGLFDNKKIGIFLDSVIKHKLDIEDITLQELYDIIPIKLTVKVFNVTRKNLEYISHETDPHLSLSLLGMMTTAIPFFFRPIEYNECMYVDGGLRGHFPIENCKSDNYLGLFVLGGSVPKESELLDLFPIIRFIHSLMINQDDIIYELTNGEGNKDIIYVEVNQGLDFKLSLDRKEEIIQTGYDVTIKHLHEYFTEN